MKKLTSVTAVKEDWVMEAMTDDAKVVEVLLRMKHLGTVLGNNPRMNLPMLRWGKRQRRSRSSRFGGGGGVLASSLKKDVDSIRTSPKTPLFWNGGGSTSPSTDGFDEDTSRQTSCSTSTGSGSKVFPTNEIHRSFSKRLNKKKSSSELKNEENLKLKERHDLEKEITSLRATFDEHNMRNQRLKKIKLDLNPGRVKKETAVDLIRNSVPVDGKNEKSFFVVPDLNMVPSEGDIL